MKRTVGVCVSFAALCAACRSVAPFPEAVRSAPPTASSAVEEPSASPAVAPKPSVQVAPLAHQAPSGLSAQLLRAFNAQRSNVFFSAASLRAALGMAALGARGRTLAQVGHALELSADPKQNAEAAAQERAAWRRAAGQAELSIANRLWIDKSFALRDSFIDLCRRGYDATAGRVDFVHAPGASRTAINHWVSGATRGRISDLLPPGSIDQTTRLVVTDAIYFKGTWAKAFPKAATQPQIFHALAGKKRVPMMHLKAKFGYAETGDVQLVELPYRQSHLSLLIALPKPNRSLAAVVKKLSRAEIDNWSKSVRPTQIALALPKFRLSWGRSVKPALETLGVRAAFDSKLADFSGAARGPLFVGDVFQKAFIVVDEAGTEAAAASGATMRLRALVLSRAVNVNRPFLFFIRAGKDGPLLFAGSVVDP